jgi:type II secretory pathway component PulF
MNFYKIVYIFRGERLSEVVGSHTKSEAIQALQLRFSGAILIDVKETSAPVEVYVQVLSSFVQKLVSKQIPLSYKIATIRQIAVMSDAGLPLDEVIYEVAQGVAHKSLQDIYLDIYQSLHTGRSFYDAFRVHQEEFGVVTLTMVQLADQTGRVAEAFYKLADILEVLRENRASFKKALRIPLITLFTMVLAFVVIMHMVVPKFKEVFLKFNAELPWVTELLFGIEAFFSQYGMVVLGGLVIGYGVVHVMYRRCKKCREMFDGVLIHPRFYLVHPIIFYASMHKYNLVFTQLVSTGIPIAEALKIAVNMVENRAIQKRFLSVNNSLAKGLSLSEAFQATQLYEPMLLHMLKSGEVSGKLEEMLQKITDYYARRFQNIIDNLTTYIEPIMMFFMATLVLLLALGIFMPMWDLSQVMKR